MDDALLPLLSSALWTVLWVAGPAVLAAALCAGVAGIVQSVTQVQDATLSFVPRLVGVVVALAAGGHAMLTRLTELTGQLWQQMH